jgi:flagellar biogenesis protein FliO
MMKAEMSKTTTQKNQFSRSGFFQRFKQWLSSRARPWGACRQRQLRLCENLPLGERRFLSLVECGRQKFLLGGCVNSLVVLAELPSEATTTPTKDSEDVPTYKFAGRELIKDVLCG